MKFYNKNIKSDTSTWLLLIVFAALVFALYLITKWGALKTDPLSQALEGKITGQYAEEYNKERMKMLQPTDKEKIKQAKVGLRDGYFWIKLGTDMQKKAQQHKKRGIKSSFWDNYYNDIEDRGKRYEKKGGRW
ncbi:hypothetical protein B9J78_05205 [bacterium Unc6]|nr:hypothetical protein [bacterium Unc6]